MSNSNISSALKRKLSGLFEVCSQLYLLIPRAVGHAGLASRETGVERRANGTPHRLNWYTHFVKLSSVT